MSKKRLYIISAVGYVYNDKSYQQMALSMAIIVLLLYIVKNP